MRRNILVGILTTMIITNNVLAGEVVKSTVINGYTTSSRPNPVYNINPYNISTYKGVGEGGSLKLFGNGEIVEIPLETPLYKLSEGYSDKIINKDDVWGVERNVGVYEFTGAENWELYTANDYNNTSTVIFTCNSPIENSILNGLCTHFDVLSDKDMKTTIYDGISFSTDGNKIFMRFMNVRNVTTVENIKNFLYSQNINGTPVKLLYFIDKPVFEAFDEDIQNKLNGIFDEDNIKNIGYTDANLQKIEFNGIEKNLNTDIFNTYTTNDEKLDNFLTGITDLKIYNSGDESYFISEVYADSNNIKISIKDSNNIIYTGLMSYSELNFINDKNTEVVLSNENSDVIIRMQINLSKTKVPLGTISLNDNTVLLNDSCKTNMQVIVPEKIYYTDNGNTEVYLSNTIISGESTANRDFKVYSKGEYTFNETNNSIKPDIDNENTVVYYSFDDKNKYSVEFEYIPKQNIDKTLNVMFLGDSLINEEYYSKYVKELFNNDGVKLNLIGTRGTDDNKHEGRGGWSAYNYCHSVSTSGYTNPFLNNGKFDFKYYMEQNKFETPDYIILNLGINDLNLNGHNSFNEIFENFDTIINSIHEYNKDINIIINTPVLLYETDKTNTAKTTRLVFNEVLMERYSEGYENVVVCPSYTVLNPRTDYKLIEQNNNDTMIVTDTTHPNIYGYKNMADITYTYINYVEYCSK